METTSSTSFGRYLDKNKITLEQAAAGLGISEGWVRQIKNGTKTPGVKLARGMVEWSNGRLRLAALLDGPLRRRKAA